MPTGPWPHLPSPMTKQGGHNNLTWCTGINQLDTAEFNVQHHVAGAYGALIVLAFFAVAIPWSVGHGGRGAELSTKEWKKRGETIDVCPGGNRTFRDHAEAE